MPVEHTLALITPEGMPHAKKIISRIKKEGFTILARRTVHLTPEQVSDFYYHLYGQRDFPLLVASTSVAPVTALCVGRHRAVEKLVEIVGPRDIAVAIRDALGSLNALYGSVECNLAAVHASADLKAARREIFFFFPQCQVEPWTGLEEGLEWLEEHVKPLLKEGLAQMLKEKPAEPMLWLADWLLQNNPNQPQVEQHLRHHPLSKLPKY